MTVITSNSSCTKELWMILVVSAKQDHIGINCMAGVKWLLRQI